MITENAILDALRTRVGIDAAQTGEVSLRKEIRRTIASCSDPGRLLDPSSPEWKALLESVVVPETWFFRNLEAFEALAAWIAGVWAPAHPGARLRVLSLPCASGEEPYSIAMCLLEAGLAPDRFQILAGDISRECLAKARAAAYGRNSFRAGFDESRFGQYFADGRQGTRKVREDICRMVEFDEMNLAGPASEIPPSDVIFCRNALIYFGSETQLAVVSRLGDALSDDGILFLGPVEPPIAMRCGFGEAGFPMSFACVKSASHHPKPPATTSRLRPVAAQAKLFALQKNGATGGPPDTASSSGMGILPMRDLPSKGKMPRPQFSAKMTALSGPPAAPADSINLARALADSGDAEGADAILARLADASSPTAELFCLRGVVSEVLGRGALAEAFYRKALYLDPSHYESLAHLSTLLELDGRKEAAKRLRWRACKVTAP